MNVKISELSEVNELYPGCCFPIVQNGETKKVTFETLGEMLGIENKSIDSITTSIVTGEDGTKKHIVTINLTDETSTTFEVSDGAAGPVGPAGPEGKEGPKGKKGDAPVRGVDYWTAEDVAAIKAQCEVMARKDLDDVLVPGTAEGKNITLNDSAKYYATVSPKGKSVQNGTPTPDIPVEIESVSGRNLFDKSDVTGGWIGADTNQIYDTYTDLFSYTNYIKVKPNTTYTLNFHDASSLSGGGIMEYDSNKAWLNIGLPETQQVITFTTSENTYYIRFTVRNDSLNYVQLEQGTTATEYVPYNHIAIKSTGKNLFNKEITTTGKYINSDGEIAEYYSYSISDYIKVTANKVYSYQGITEYSEYGAFYDSNKNLISTFLEITMAENQKITIPPNAEYVRFTITNTNDIDNFQLELGDIATKYEQYISNQVNIPLLHPLRSVTDEVYDSIHKQNIKWYDEQKVKPVIYNATETGWTYYSGQDKDNTVFFQRTVGDRATTYGYKTVPLLCNRLINRAVYGVDQEGIYLQSSNGVLMVRLNRSRLSEISTAGFLAWLAENNLEVQYEINTPVVTEITDADTITALENLRTYKGVTNITADGPIKVDYKKDLETLFNNLQAQILANGEV